MTRPDDAARTRVPDLYLERYRLGELPEDERHRIEQLLELDPELRGRLEALEASDAEIASRATPPPSWTSGSAAGPAPPGSPGARRASTRPGGWLMPALAAAAIVLAVGVGVGVAGRRGRTTESS